MGAILLILFLLHFYLKLSPPKKIGIFNGLFKFIFYVVAIFLFILLPTSLIVKNVSIAPAYQEAPGQFYSIFAVYFISGLIYCWIRLFRGFQESTGAHRNQLKFLLFAILMGLISSFIAFVSILFNPNLSYVSFYVFEVAYISVTAYAITKHRLMNISVVISRTLAWSTTVIFLGGIYSGLVWLYQIYVSIQINLMFLAGTILYGILVGATFQKIRIFLQTTADRTFVKGWYDSRKVLRKIATGLGKTLTHEDIVKALYPIFQDDMDISESRVYFLDRNSASYIEWVPGTEGAKTNNVLSAEASLVKHILSQRDIMSFEGKLCVPSFSGDQLVAIFILGRKRSEDEYSDEDYEVFRTIGEYVAIALEYIVKPYEEVKEKFEASERKLVEAERQIERSSRLASLGTLAAGVAHEIRNPMTVLRSKAQKLSARLDDKEFLKEYAGLTLKHIDRILDIVKSMLDMARTKEFERKPVNINALIEETLRFFSISKINVVKNLNPVPEAPADSSQLTQVFINLIQNAVRAMPEGGTLGFTTGIENGQIKIQISDTGIGIPSENLEKIFDPFFTTWHEGAGLGLSNAHRIITDHGGRIEVKSKAGKGTDFIIYFPVL